MTDPFRRWLLVALISVSAACRPDPGKEEWTPPPAAAPAAELLSREACSERDPLRRPFYGDLHVHTHYSMDAWARGTRLTPDDAYRFASGRQIELVFFDHEDRISNLAQIDRPLDFAAVTDHAEWLGEVSLCTTSGSPVYETRACRIYRGETKSLLARLVGLKGFYANLIGLIGFTGRNREVCGEDSKHCRGAVATAWSEIQGAAERWYDRSPACSFTTFHAWEYSRSPASTKVHRNVILRSELSTPAVEGDGPQGQRAPVFAAWAHRDLGRADGGEGLLQRIQMVKGWVGDDGGFHQAVFDVAGDPNNGAGVDPQTCDPVGPGADQLCAVWRDPGFDPGRAAVYYTRVVENPSCRWSTRRCLALPETERPDGCNDPAIPKTVQERAWTSPIWIEPQD